MDHNNILLRLVVFWAASFSIFEIFCTCNTEIYAFSGYDRFEL